MNFRFSKIAALLALQACSVAAAQTIATGKITRDPEVAAAIEIFDAAGKPPPAPAKTKTKALTSKSQKLPGVGEIPGYKDYFKPVVIRASTTKTEVIDISNEFQNRISTPFAVPKVIDQSKSNIEKLGQSIYIKPVDSSPITIFITGSSPNDPVISLTLVPKSIPSQTLLLQLDKTDGNGIPVEDERPLSDGYSDGLRFLFRQVALGKVPPGYAEAPLPSAIASVRGMTVRPVARYSGPKTDLYAYQVEGASEAAVELEENAFMQQGVRAVAFFPTSTVRRGEATMVYVLSDKVDQ